MVHAPVADIELAEIIPDGSTFWTPKPSDIDEEGFGFFRNVTDLRGTTAKGARGYLAAHSRVFDFIDSRATTVEDFDDLASSFECGSAAVDGLTGAIGTEVDAFIDAADCDLGILELGVGAVSYALSAAITALVKVSEAAPLLEVKGFGAITAATCLTVWSHRGRVHSEAAFASLAGVNPIPASSGNTVRHRLNRGGDRKLNSALHMVAVTRMTHDEENRQYVSKRAAEGLSTKEIRRCLKRYLARRVYRVFNAHEEALRNA